MDDKFTAALVTIITAVIGVSVLSVILSPKAQTAKVFGAFSQGFSQILSAATAPVTGASTLSSSISGLGSLTDFGSSLGGLGGLGGFDPSSILSV